MSFSSGYRKQKDVPLFVYIVLIIMFLAFFVFGLTIFLQGLVDIKSFYYFKSTDITNFEDIKENSIIKLSGKPFVTRQFISPILQKPCILYKTDYLDERRSKNNIYYKILKTDMKLESLTITDNNRLINIEITPEIEKSLKIIVPNFNSIKKDVSSQDNTYGNPDIDRIVEKIITPYDNILVFGQVKEVIRSADNRIITLKFKSESMKGPQDVFTQVLPALFGKHLSFFVISTMVEDATADGINLNNYLIQTAGGMVFLLASLIPLIIFKAIVKNKGQIIKT